MKSKHMEGSQPKTGLLIELDAILDLRAGTVRKLYGKQIADDLIKNVGYRCRKSDELHLIDPRINDKDYTFSYLKRDMETLDHSHRSLISTYVNQLIAKLQLAIDGNNPILNDVSVIVNYHPFNLSEDEKLYIAAGITSTIGLAETVRMVYLPPEAITLDYLQQHRIFTYVLYDFDRWTVAALPDVTGSSLEEAGLQRVDNLTIIAARLAKLDQQAREVEELVKSYQLPTVMDDLNNLVWALIFDLEMLDPVFYTEFDESIAEKIMSVIEKSNSPIDIEVGLIQEYTHILTPAMDKRTQITLLLDRLNVIRDQLVKNYYSFNGGETDQFDGDAVRRLLAEQRFINDALQVFTPSKPAEDYERLVDSMMSQFDSSMETSEMSEHYWNKIGVRCRRIVRDIPALSRSAYLLVAAEDVTDENGVYRAKNSILPSCTFFDPILETIPFNEIDEFKKEMLHG